MVPTEAFRRGDFSAAPTLVYDPATGDAAGNGRTPFPGNQIPAEPDQPDCLAADAEDAAAEPPGRGARPGQLPGELAAREGRPELRREVQLGPQRQRPVVVPPELSAAGGRAAAGGRLRRLGWPARQRLHGDRCHQHVQHRRQLDADVHQHLRHGVARRPQLLPQRGAPHGLRTGPGAVGGHQRRQPRRLDQRADDHPNPERIQQPGARLLAEPPVGPVGEDVAVRHDADQAVGQPHGEVRRRLAAQLGHAAADPGEPGAARPGTRSMPP